LARNGLNQFIAVNAHVLGAVLNDVDMERDGYYYRYYYYYDYYYAEDGQRRKKR
jgi:Mrp family chromosome partitioning ATPase